MMNQITEDEMREMRVGFLKEDALDRFHQLKGGFRPPRPSAVWDADYTKPTITLQPLPEPDTVDKVIQMTKQMTGAMARPLASLMEADARKMYEEERQKYVAHTMSGNETEYARQMQETFERRVYRSFDAIIQEAVTIMTSEFERRIKDTVQTLRIEVGVLQDQLTEVIRDVYEEEDES